MDDYLYYPTLLLILVQIVGSAAVIVGGIVEFARGSSQQEYRGQKRMSALNHLAFNGFSFLVGLVLLQLLHGEKVSTLFLLLASTFTELLAVLVNYLYQTSVPSPDQLETPNRYLPNTSAQALVDQADAISQHNRRDDFTSRET